MTGRRAVALVLTVTVLGGVLPLLAEAVFSAPAAEGSIGSSLYGNLVMRDDPFGYWRFQGSAGTSPDETDPSNGNYAFQYTTGLSQGQASPLLDSTDSTDTAWAFSQNGGGTNDREQPGDLTQLTLEGWVKIATTTPTAAVLLRAEQVNGPAMQVKVKRPRFSAALIRVAALG